MSDCLKEINVSDLAEDHEVFSWFSDGETVEVNCPHCDHENKLRINIHVSYEVFEKNHTKQIKI